MADDPRADAHLGELLTGTGLEVLGSAVGWCRVVAVAAAVRPDLVMMEPGRRTPTFPP